MKDKQFYYKLDDLRIIGTQSEQVEAEKKMHARATSKIFEELKSLKSVPIDKSFDRLTANVASKEKIKNAKEKISKNQTFLSKEEK